MILIFNRIKIVYSATMRKYSFVLGAALLTLACGSDADPASTADTTGPLYVTATRVFTADSSSGYLTTFSSLEAGTQVDLSHAIELEDAWVFGKADPYLYTATIFSPTIKRWEVSKNGELVEGPTLSFANAGVEGTFVAASTPLYSKDKSYFIDSASQQIVIWNPSDMSFIGTIPLEVEVPEGLETWLDLAVTEDRLVASAFFSDPNSGNTKYGAATQLFIVDPKTDRVVGSSTDTRCETLSPAGSTSDGTTYFTPWDYHAAVRTVFGEGFGSRSCALRVVPPDTELDRGYEIDLSSLVGGRPAGTMRLVGDDQALIHVWNPDLVDATPDNWDDTRWEAGYTWYRWKLGDETATELPEQTPSGEGGDWETIDGKTYALSPNSDYDETTLVELNADGQFVPGAKIQGWTAHVIRVR